MRGLLILAVLAATPALAQSCPAPTGWAKPARHLAARTSDFKFALATGTSNEIGLLPANYVKLAAPSGRKAKPGTMAGLAAIDVAKAGKLDVILSTAAYVDLVRDGRALQSSGHSDLKTCPGFRKSVTFDVVAGRYVVQLTGAPGKSVKMATVLR